MDISGDLTANEICDKITETIKTNYGDTWRDNLYKIELVGEIAEDTEISLEEITARLKPQVYFIKIKDRTEYKLDYEALAKEPTLKGIFIRKMLEKEAAASDIEKPLIRDALTLGLKAFTKEVKYDED